MRCAVGIPNVGPFGDPGLLVELAVAAEDAGWDGWFLWDHLLHHDPAWPVSDPIVTVSAAAAVTTRLRLGVLMLALPRRRPWKVAKELATIDRLSGGRLVTGFGLGSMEREYTAFGEDPDLRARALALDEGLDVIVRAWTGDAFSFHGTRHRVDGVRMRPTPLQEPRPPVWLAGRWPNRAPFERAARWDGVMPIHRDHGRGQPMPPSMVRQIRDLVVARRGTAEGFDIALEGSTDGGDGIPPAYAEAGLTWWVEALGWWRGGTQEAYRRVAAGPPRVPRDA